MLTILQTQQTGIMFRWSWEKTSCGTGQDIRWGLFCSQRCPHHEDTAVSQGLKDHVPASICSQPVYNAGLRTSQLEGGDLPT